MAYQSAVAEELVAWLVHFGSFNGNVTPVSRPHILTKRDGGCSNVTFERNGSYLGPPIMDAYQ